MKKIYHNILYGLLYAFFWGLSIPSERVRYGVFKPLLYWMLYRVGGYRIGVVRENLRNSFPEKSDQERLDIEKKYYHQLAEVFIDSVSMMTISRKRLLERIHFENHDQIEKEMTGRSWICAMAHYGSWELQIGYALKTSHKLLAVYHPLENDAFERIYKRFRSRFGGEPLSMKLVGRRLVQAQKSHENVILALIADQTPPFFEPSAWHTFLNQDTKFFSGMGRLSLKYHYPIYFLDLHKSGQNSYSARFVQLYDGVQPITIDEISARYGQMLEAMIRREPWLWVWSHKRWKHKRTE